MTTYEIKPIDLTFNATTHTLKYILMAITYQVGMETMLVPFNLCDENGNSYWSGTAFVNKEQLDAWGTDNMYIVDIVAQQAGVVLV